MRPTDSAETFWRQQELICPPGMSDSQCVATSFVESQNIPVAASRVSLEQQWSLRQARDGICLRATLFVLRVAVEDSEGSRFVCILKSSILSKLSSCCIIQLVPRISDPAPLYLYRLAKLRQVSDLYEFVGALLGDVTLSCANSNASTV